MKETPGIVITYPFPMGYYNGGTRSIREISIQLGRQGIPVYILTVSSKVNSHFPRPIVEEERLGYELDDQLASYGTTITRIRPNIFHPFLDGLNLRKALKELLAKKPLAAVYSFYREGIFLPSLLRSIGIPFNILAIWQSYEVAMKTPSKVRKPFQYVMAVLMQKMIRNCYQQAEQLFAISNHTGRELVRYLDVKPEKVNTCYLGVSPEFSTLKRPKPEKINRFLFFGRIIETKGIADAIEALRRLKAKGYEDWEFHINGEGYPEWARSLIVKAGLKDRIFIHKPTNDLDLHHFLESGHLLLMPSRYESFGLSFAEGQAAGLPVIGYAAGSVPEVVAHGKTGWLAPTGDINQITSYLIQAIEGPEHSYQMGLAGRERVKRLFTWEKTAETILSGLRPLHQNPSKVETQNLSQSST